MNKTLEYILLKAVQISALIYLPLKMYWMCEQPFSFGHTIWMGIDGALLGIYIDDFINKTLEKRLHGELY